MRTKRSGNTCKQEPADEFAHKQRHLPHLCALGI